MDAGGGSGRAPELGGDGGGSGSCRGDGGGPAVMCAAANGQLRVHGPHNHACTQRNEPLQKAKADQSRPMQAKAGQSMLKHAKARQR